MSLKNILVVAENLDVDASSGAKANQALIMNFYRAGFNVRVLHYTRKDIVLKGIEVVSIPETKFTFFYFLSRSQRILTRMLKFNMHHWLEGLFGFSFTFFNDCNSIVRSIRNENIENVDLLISLSQGSSFRPHYALLKMPEYHEKWMAYIHDPYPFHFYPRPYNFVQPGFRKKEEFFLKLSQKAKYSAFPSMLLKSWMTSYFPAFNDTGIILPHQLTQEVAISSEFSTLILRRKFTMLHSGNMMPQRDPSFLLMAFVKFLSMHPDAINDAALIFIGPLQTNDTVINKYKADCENISFVNKQVAFKEILKLQNQAQVNVILESVAEISPFLPGKFPHCVAADKPILLLCPYYSESKRLLGEKYPYWAEANDVDKIAAIILELFLSFKESKSEVSLNRPDLLAYCDYKYLKEQLVKIGN